MLGSKLNHVSKRGPRSHRKHMNLAARIGAKVTRSPKHRARRFPLPDGPGQVKLPVGQVDLDGFFFFISYKQIEEFQISWSRASDDFEKRRALKHIHCDPDLSLAVLTTDHKDQQKQVTHIMQIQKQET